MDKDVRKVIPKIRAEKSGNQNKDDFRVIVAGSFLCLCLVLIQSWVIDEQQTKATNIDLVSEESH